MEMWHWGTCLVGMVGWADSWTWWSLWSFPTLMILCIHDSVCQRNYCKKQKGQPLSQGQDCSFQFCRRQRTFCSPAALLLLCLSHFTPDSRLPLQLSRSKSLLFTPAISFPSSTSYSTTDSSPGLPWCPQWSQLVSWPWLISHTLEDMDHPIPGRVQGQVGWGPGQPGLVLNMKVSSPACCSGVGASWSLRPLPTQAILWFHDSISIPIAAAITPLISLILPPGFLVMKSTSLPPALPPWPYCF